MLIPAALSSCRALSTTVLRLCACLSAGADTLPSRSVLEEEEEGGKRRRGKGMTLTLSSCNCTLVVE